jgi:hypothetical protein
MLCGAKHPLPLIGSLSPHCQVALWLLATVDSLIGQPIAKVRQIREQMKQPPVNAQQLWIVPRPNLANAPLASQDAC